METASPGFEETFELWVTCMWNRPVSHSASVCLALVDMPHITHRKHAERNIYGELEVNSCINEADGGSLILCVCVSNAS